MKISSITLKGWVNKSDYLTCQNSTNEVFIKNFNEFKKDMEDKGFKRLNISFDTLKGKNATEKIIVKGWYWKGGWSDNKKHQVAVFYKN